MASESVVRTGEPDSVVVFLNPLTMARNLWRHRELALQLAKRDIIGRYRTAQFGLLWAIITPLILLAVYTFVFSVIFQARWGTGAEEGRGAYALAMFCGLVLFTLFAEVVNRSPTMIVYCPNYVKKVVFPLEVLVPSGLLSALFNMLIGYGVWLAGWLLIKGAWPQPTILYFPVVLVPVCLFIMGVGWFLSSIGVFIRDVGHAVGVCVQIMFFMTPIFYRVEQVPERFRPILEINPLTHAIEDMRRILISGEQPDWSWWLISTCAAGLLALLGYAFFMKSKRAFGDVI